MNITVNNTCSQITVTSDILLITNTANTLKVTYKGVEHNVTVPTNISTFTITPAHVGMTGTFTDGVYTIFFRNTLTGGAVKEDRGCAVALCTTKCSNDMQNWYMTKDLDKVLTYEALKVGQDCTSCSCSTLEKLFNDLTQDDSDTCSSCCCTV